MVLGAKLIKTSVNPTSTQEAVRLLLYCFKTALGAKKLWLAQWTRRLSLSHIKVGEDLHTANSETSKDFLHEAIRGILMAETSGLTSSAFASVLAMSGTTGNDSDSIGNSWKNKGLA